MIRKEKVKRKKKDEDLRPYYAIVKRWHNFYPHTEHVVGLVAAPEYYKLPVPNEANYYWAIGRLNLIDPLTKKA